FLLFSSLSTLGFSRSPVVPSAAPSPDGSRRPQTPGTRCPPNRPPFAARSRPGLRVILGPPNRPWRSIAMALWKNLVMQLGRLSPSPPPRGPDRRPARSRPAVVSLEARTAPAGADLFADATVLTGSFARDTDTNNTGATFEPGEPAGNATSGVV